MEEWRDIKYYNGKYQISNKGRVRNNKGKILKPLKRGKGYQGINLSMNGYQTFLYIHRLVAIHFIDNPENKPEVNHKDYNRQNNIVENLEWVTHRENSLYSRDNMKKRHHCKTSSGERYICKVGKKYVVFFDRKYYGRFDDLGDAVRRRDEICQNL